MREARDRLGRIKGKKLKSLCQSLGCPLRFCMLAGETENGSSPCFLSIQRLGFQGIKAHDDIVHEYPSSCGCVVGRIGLSSLGVVVGIPGVLRQPFVILVIDLGVRAVAPQDPHTGLTVSLIVLYLVFPFRNWCDSSHPT